MKCAFSWRSSETFVLLVLILCVLVSASTAQPNIQGQWNTLSNTMPINPVHVALLANGKILVVAGSGNCAPTDLGCPSGPPYGPSNNSGALLWDPTTESYSQSQWFSLSWDMFCNGMVLLQDGRALIDGGTIQYSPSFYGEQQVAIFDPATNTFNNTQNMAHGRWYPTVLTLGDGRVMTFSGLNETGGGTNAAVEFYTVGSGWSPEYIASWTPDLYPRMHLLPNGKVFYSGGQTQSKLFDPATTTWSTNVATTNYSVYRGYGTSVLLPLTPNNYDPKVIIMGGGSPATNTTEIIDMGASTPAWQYGPNMSQARIEMNAVILPNGKVLALGGSVNDEDTSTASLDADLLGPDPQNPGKYVFSSAGTNAYPRLYHSVALLLPDATVWLAGGNSGAYVQQIEIYKPAYLFNPDGTMATRPSITSAPSSISYGNTFSVTTPDATNISSVVLVRNGTVTHAFGMDQREVGMSFTAGSGTLTVTAPPNGNIAPPGYYMLFILNTSGVPSVATFVQMIAATAPPDFSVLATPSSQTVAPGTGTSYTVSVTPSNGFTANVSFSVSGLPSGATASFSPTSVSGSGSSTLTVNTSGSTPTGTYTLTITATSGTLIHSTTVILVIGRSNFIPQTGWTLKFVDSQETVGENGAATNAFDGQTNTMWVTQWLAASPPPPHEIQINLGASYSIVGFTYLPRQDGCSNGDIKQYEFYVSVDGADWGNPVASGTFNYGNSFIYACPGGVVVPAIVVNFPAVTGSFVRLRALSEMAGNPWTAVSELNVISTVSNTNPPATPTNLTATAGSGQVGLSWSASSGATSYNVKRSTTSGGPYATIASPTTTSYTDTGVTNGTTYYYVVSAANTAGQSANSSQVSATPTASPDFSVLATPSSQTVAPGTGTSYTVSVTPSNGFTANVSFSVSGLPSGATASFSPTSVSGSGSSTLTVNTSGSTPTGTYTLTITATSGTLIHSTTVILVVGDFSISVSPSSQTVNRGSATQYTVTITPVGSFSATVNLSVTGLPKRTTASFNPSSLKGSGTSTLTVSVNRSATTGTYPLTVRATGGGATHSQNVSLVIQ